MGEEAGVPTSVVGKYYNAMHKLEMLYCFIGIEDRHADYLLKHLKPVNGGADLKCTHERSVVVYNYLPRRLVALLGHDHDPE